MGTLGFLRVVPLSTKVPSLPRKFRDTGRPRTIRSEQSNGTDQSMIGCSLTHNGSRGSAFKLFGVHTSSGAYSFSVV